MSAGNWVAIVLGVVALCWLVAWFDEIANGSPSERKKAKKAKKDTKDIPPELHQGRHN